MLDVERRIPDSLGFTDTLIENAPLVGTIEFNDGIIAFGPSFFVFLVLSTILPPSLAFGSTVGFVITLGLGLLFLIARPDHLTMRDWITQYWEYRNRPKERHMKLQTDGGQPRTNNAIENSPDTRDITNVARIYPHADAVERTDGAMVGMVKVEGLNLDTALQQQWTNAANQLANFVNTQIDYPFQFYLPMRQFDPSDYVQSYVSRLETDDELSNDILEEYLEDRVSWMESISYQSYIRECYVVISVSKHDVLNSELNSENPVVNTIEKNETGKMVSDIVKATTGNQYSSTLSEDEIKDRQLKELHRRLREIQGGLSGGEHSQVSIVETNKLGVLLKEYWEGVSIPEMEADDFVRDQPLITAGDSQ